SPRLSRRLLAQDVLRVQPRPDIHLPGPYPDATGVLGEAGLPDPAALRHGGGSRDFAPGDHLAGAGPQALACRLCPALAAAQGWALRREPQPAAALLPVPGDPEAVAYRRADDLSGKPKNARYRSQAPRYSLCRGRLGEPDARRLGPRLGSL